MKNNLLMSTMALAGILLINGCGNSTSSSTNDDGVTSVTYAELNTTGDTGYEIIYERVASYGTFTDVLTVCQDLDLTSGAAGVSNVDTFIMSTESLKSYNRLSYNDENLTFTYSHDEADGLNAIDFSFVNNPSQTLEEGQTYSLVHDSDNQDATIKYIRHDINCTMLGGSGSNWAD